MNITRILTTNVRLCPGRITTSVHNLYKNQLQCCCGDNSKRQFSLQSSVESVAKTQSGIFQSISESTPVEYAQKLLLNIHETTGLPWWATIVSTTILMRATITFPLAIYQNYILAKVENLSLEMPAIAKELKKEIGVAVRLYKWDEKMAKMQYKLTMKKEWNKLIVRDNCHPVKSSLLLWFQIPMWVSLSVSLRNLVYQLPNQDFTAKMTLTELSVGGFGWIPNLVEVDSSLILPVTLGLINLAIIEIQTLSKVNVPSKLQRYATNFFRGFSVLMIPIAASVPSCMALYWTTSSAFGLVQNMILMSPKVKKSFNIPLTASQLEKPYAHLLAAMKHKYLPIK
ncbi:PREDICTED: mitochondrial inner membrane protein COX18 [Nicrophorus vespilloides]|uniref:Mitochondrial inner membrane protein COX18 n=1 Tax=Nicrophorus vespilloides TaxID=110193 RepID=A0ABM1NDJ9_NICVS|nr:PREDICTED: mitochondrial inner membrane protein COX18 [Nicrophorus vespilloides]